MGRGICTNILTTQNVSVNHKFNFDRFLFKKIDLAIQPDRKTSRDSCESISRTYLDMALM